MEGITPENVEFVIDKIEDGRIFEEFASNFLVNVFGYNFAPQGGLKDKGIDGLEYIQCREDLKTHIFQFSIQKNPKTKLMSTLVKLEDNGIKYDKLYFVTNQSFPDQYKIIDEALVKFKKPVQVLDIKWFSSNINGYPGAIRVFNIFTDRYLQDFKKPGKTYLVADPLSDPRLFIFLRQQWDLQKNSLRIDQILVDSLIIFALEDTDPQKGIVKTEKEILVSIQKLIKFDPKVLYRLIGDRLKVISKKPRRIQYHPQLNGYCLPYETREQIKERNIKDSVLYDKFMHSIEDTLKIYLKEEDVKIKDCMLLVNNIIHLIFSEQGIEFADFILKGEDVGVVEKKLPDLILKAVDESGLVIKDKERVKNVIGIVIRSIVYDGSMVQKEFLQKISHTYLMLFLLQCDPKLALCFNTIASNLNIYVCSSIIIPALSEYFLDPVNRRHWNLLKGAHESGVDLIISEVILDELSHHFLRIKNIFDEQYKNHEDLYTDEMEILYIEEIMIRAYFYAKMRNKTSSFKDFLDCFIDPNTSDLETIKSNLIVFLKDQFGIQFHSDKSKRIQIKQEDEVMLFDKLRALKRYSQNARVDAHVILGVYYLRELNNERSGTGIIGYKTWWLSKDVSTYRTVKEVFGDKYPVSCYMRPDFLYNYIALAPRKQEAEEAFSFLFPSLIGINISFHLPSDIIDVVHKQIKEHKDKSPSRVRAILKDLMEKLISDPTYKNKEYVNSYLDEALKKIPVAQSAP